MYFKIKKRRLQLFFLQYRCSGKQPNKQNFYLTVADYKPNLKLDSFQVTQGQKLSIRLTFDSHDGWRFQNECQE